MNPQDIIGLLQPLRAPAAVSWWPPAPGWWMLLCLLLAALAAVSLWFWRRHRRRAPLRAARRELLELRRSPQAAGQDAETLMALLRRVALAVDPGGAGARSGQTGEPWIAYLEGLTRQEERLLDADLATLAYRPPSDSQNLDAACAGCERWLLAVEKRL